MAPETLTPAIAGLLASAGMAEAGFDCRPLPAGGNNRVYRVRCVAGDFAVKHYFHGDGGERDRLGCEFAFLRHAWSQGIRCVPQPLAADSASHLALYEFVDGRRLEQAEIDEERIVSAARFFAALNAPASRGAAAALPNASDACLGGAQHVASVDRRIETLCGLRQEDDLGREAHAFVAEMASQWQAARQRVLQAVGPLDPAQRCLSPSDFGFHNALARKTDASLCFLDFEYAGWDDPAKMTGDFFWHAGMRPPREHFRRFAALALAPFGEADALVERVRLLGPVFRLRWCCIALNEFVADSARRRRFADPADDAQARKRSQLAKARALFAEPDLL